MIRSFATLLVAVVLAGCAAAPVTPPQSETTAAAPQKPVFSDARTYAVAIRSGDASASALKVFCDVTEATAYRLRYNRFGWPTCSARELYVGLDGLQVEGLSASQRWPLPDGRQIEIWPVIDVGAGVDGMPRPGRYTLAALSRRPDEIEVLTGPLVVYRIVPGKIHFVGELGPDGTPVRRDAAGFARLFGGIFPEVDPQRLETSPVSGATMTCSPFRSIATEPVTLGFNCRGTRTRNATSVRASPPLS